MPGNQKATVDPTACSANAQPSTLLAEAFRWTGEGLTWTYDASARPSTLLAKGVQMDRGGTNEDLGA